MALITAWPGSMAPGYVRATLVAIVTARIY